MYRPKDEIRRMLEQTLIPPTNVVELDPDTLEATTIRFNSTQGNLAEQYQVNSCLGPAQWNRLADKQTAEVVMDFYIKTAQEGYDGLISERSGWALPITQAPDWVKLLTGPLVENPAVVATLYSCDLLFGFEGNLWRLIPGRPGLQFEGTWGGDQTASVQRAIGHPDMAEPLGFVFLSANIIRASYLLGDRAFRVAAIGCGVLYGLLSAALTSQPAVARWQVTNRFIDEPVNAAVRCDGVERGVQVVGLVYPVPSNEPTDSEVTS